MPLVVRFGEPLWRDLGLHQLEFQVDPSGLAWPDLVGRLQSLASAKNPPAHPSSFSASSQDDQETGLLLILNKRVIPPAEIPGLILHDGDELALMVMLSGG